MKANAPERLYLSETIYSTYLYQVPDPDDESAVEYTRTEAFIEKACEHLQINLWRVVNEEPDFRQRFVTNFRNYMEGE